MATTKKINLTVEELNSKLALIEISIPGNVNDQLTYFVKKLFKKATDAVKPFTENYQDGLQDIYVKYASTDDKGVLITDGDKYKFTPENQAKVNAKIRALRKELNTNIVEFEATLANDDCPRIKELDLFVRDELAGFLFETII